LQDSSRKTFQSWYGLSARNPIQSVSEGEQLEHLPQPMLDKLSEIEAEITAQAKRYAEQFHEAPGLAELKRRAETGEWKAKVTSSLIQYSQIDEETIFSRWFAGETDSFSYLASPFKAAGDHPCALRNHDEVSSLNVAFRSGKLNLAMYRARRLGANKIGVGMKRDFVEVRYREVLEPNTTIEDGKEILGEHLQGGQTIYKAGPLLSNYSREKVLARLLHATRCPPDSENTSCWICEESTLVSAAVQGMTMDRLWNEPENLESAKPVIMEFFGFLGEKLCNKKGLFSVEMVPPIVNGLYGLMASEFLALTTLPAPVNGIVSMGGSVRTTITLLDDAISVDHRHSTFGLSQKRMTEDERMGIYSCKIGMREGVGRALLEALQRKKSPSSSLAQNTGKLVKSKKHSSNQPIDIWWEGRDWNTTDYQAAVRRKTQHELTACLSSHQGPLDGFYHLTQYIHFTLVCLSDVVNVRLTERVLSRGIFEPVQDTGPCMAARYSLLGNLWEGIQVYMHRGCAAFSVSSCQDGFQLKEGGGKETCTCEKSGIHDMHKKPQEVNIPAQFGTCMDNEHRTCHFGMLTRLVVAATVIEHFSPEAKFIAQKVWGANDLRHSWTLGLFLQRSGIFELGSSVMMPQNVTGFSILPMPVDA